MRKTTKIRTGLHTYNVGDGEAVKRVEYKQTRVQKIVSPKKGTSALGSRFIKGQEIVHISSSRATGEVFTLTLGDLYKLINSRSHRALKRI